MSITEPGPLRRYNPALDGAARRAGSCMLLPKRKFAVLTQHLSYCPRSQDMPRQSLPLANDGALRGADESVNVFPSVGVRGLDLFMEMRRSKCSAVPERLHITDHLEGLSPPTCSMAQARW